MIASDNAANEPFLRVRYLEKPMKPQFPYPYLHAMTTKIQVALVPTGGFFRGNFIIYRSRGTVRLSRKDRLKITAT